MPSRTRLIATVLIATLLASAALAGPGAALTANATVDDPAPGAVGDYTVTLRPEEGDAIAENGLKSVTLDFAADRDYSGDLGNLSARDVEVRVGDDNGTVWAGQANVSQNGSEVTVTLEEAFENVRPGDRIVVRVFGVTNTEVALRNAQTLRGFAMRVSTTGPDGNTDGPVEARYTIDPNATAQQTPTPTSETNDSDSDAENGSDGNDSANESSAETDANETAETATDDETSAVIDTTATDTTADEGSSENGSTDGALPNTENASTANASTTASMDGTNETDETSAMDEATSTDDTTSAASTTEPAATDTTATETTQPATTGGNEGGSGGQATETTGPGFGLLVGLVALLAAGLLATRRRD